MGLSPDNEEQLPVSLVIPLLEFLVERKQVKEWQEVGAITE
jgi:hypothetical protein